MNASTKGAALLAGIAVASVGCIDVHAIHMPSGTDGSAGTGGDASAADAPAASGNDASSGDTGEARSWTGYLEQYAFASGSAAVKLTVSIDDQGVTTGAIVFGQGTPPAPVVDPTVGYPQDLIAQALRNRSPTYLDWLYLAEGYAYPITGTLDAQHLQFAANLAQLWGEWCVLQTPPGLNFGPCVTVPVGQQSGSFMSADLQMCWVSNDAQEQLRVDCGWLLLCEDGAMDVCSCTTSTCTAGHRYAAFDLFVTGETMSGSVLAPFGSYNVHFVAD